MAGFSGFCGLGNDWQCGFFGETAQRNVGGKGYAVMFEGELYGEHGGSPAEIILNGFIMQGPKFINGLNGVFAVVIWDSERLYLFRDKMGLKRLFYMKNEAFIYSTEMEGVLKFPGVTPLIDKEGLAELFSVGPARTPGFGVLKGINEVLAGGYVIFDRKGIEEGEYWSVMNKTHNDNYETTLEKTRFFLTDAVKLRLGGKVCSMLSGGLDSSIISALAQKELQTSGLILDTYSFDFIDNNEHFKGSVFQPDQDAVWALKTARFLGVSHNAMECGVSDFAERLFDAVDARGFPGMADVDSSLLYFLSEVARIHDAALTGEGADEVFGGYPWFHKNEENEFFPWSKDMEARKILLSDDFLNEIDLEAHAKKRYGEAIEKTPRMDGETMEQRQRCEIAYLNLKHFLDVLCERLSRMSQAAGVLPRVPFADHRLIEYVWNVPWEMKCREGVVKSLLRESFRGLLPNEILFRRKSPFPKCYNPEYEHFLLEMMENLISGNAPILGIIDKRKVRGFMDSRKDLGKPWFGQLMAGPQMMAYVLQVNYWMEKNKVVIRD